MFWSLLENSEQIPTTNFLRLTTQFLEYFWWISYFFSTQKKNGICCFCIWFWKLFEISLVIHLSPQNEIEVFPFRHYSTFECKFWRPSLLAGCQRYLGKNDKCFDKINSPLNYFSFSSFFFYFELFYFPPSVFLFGACKPRLLTFYVFVFCRTFLGLAATLSDLSVHYPCKGYGKQKENKKLPPKRYVFRFDKFS